MYFSNWVFNAAICSLKKIFKDPFPPSFRYSLLTGECRSKQPSRRQQLIPPSQKQVGAKGVHSSAAPVAKEKPTNPVTEAITGNSTS